MTSSAVYTGAAAGSLSLPCRGQVDDDRDVLVAGSGASPDPLTRPAPVVGGPPPPKPLASTRTAHVLTGAVPHHAGVPPWRRPDTATAVSWGGSAARCGRVRSADRSRSTRAGPNGRTCRGRVRLRFTQGPSGFRLGFNTLILTARGLHTPPEPPTPGPLIHSLLRRAHKQTRPNNGAAWWLAVRCGRICIGLSQSDRAGRNWNLGGSADPACA